MKELERIKTTLKENNIKTRVTKYGLYIYTKYTTFFIAKFDLELKGKDSKKYNDYIVETAINL